MVMLRVRFIAAACIAASLAAVPSAGAATSGTITSQTGWSTVTTLAPGVVVSRKQITVSGYSGTRTLTRVSWPLGNSHVRLDATPVAVSRYGGAQHSFGEGQISNLGASSNSLAGINGDTFCAGCANNGGDLLHGLLVHRRKIYATGSGPEVGYTPGGRMIMASARAVPVRISLPGGSATIGVWNALTIKGTSIAGDQVAVLSRRGGNFAIPATSTALVLRGSITAYGAPSTVGAQFRHMLQLAAPYQDSKDRVAGSAVSSEWVNAYRVSATGGAASTVAMPVSGGTVSGVTVTVPRDGVVLVARTGTQAAAGLAAAASRPSVSVTLDDTGWNTAAGIMDGKFQMVSNGTARTTYPGWPDSWPWYCQGVGHGCVRAAIATTPSEGWMIVETASGGNGLTMPDFARVLAQLGATNAMGFDSNSHADFWRSGASPITAFGYEPGAPAASMLSYR
jgi:hypothetical protein